MHSVPFYVSCLWCSPLSPTRRCRLGFPFTEDETQRHFSSLSGTFREYGYNIKADHKGIDVIVINWMNQLSIDIICELLWMQNWAFESINYWFHSLKLSLLFWLCSFLTWFLIENYEMRNDYRNDGIGSFLLCCTTLQNWWGCTLCLWICQLRSSYM